MPALLHIEHRLHIKRGVHLLVTPFALHSVVRVHRHIDNGLFFYTATQKPIFFLTLHEFFLQLVFQLLPAHVNFGNEELVYLMGTLISRGDSLFDDSFLALRRKIPSYFEHLRICVLNWNSSMISRHPGHFLEFSGSILIQ